MVPFALIQIVFVFKGLMSIKENYNKIVVSENGLTTIGLGGVRRYEWKQLTNFEEEKISGIRIPTYYNFEVFTNQKRILKFDSLTYLNYTKLRDAISMRMQKIK